MPVIFDGTSWVFTGGTGGGGGGGGVPDNGSVTAAKIAAGTLVTAAEGAASSDNDTSWLTTAAAKDYIDAAVAGGGITPVVDSVGDGTAGTTTVTHSMNTRAVGVRVFRNSGDYDEIEVKICRRTANAVELQHDDVWPINGYTAMVWYVGQTDVTPPTAPTLVHNSHTGTSVTLTASGSTDAVGVTGYRFFRAGMPAGTTVSGPLTITGLSPGTIYSFTACAFDAAGNQSPLSNVVAVTTTGAPATFSAVSTGVNNTGTATTTKNVSDTISVTAGQRLVAAVEVTHGSFFSHTEYTKAVTSSLNGTMTSVASQDIGTSASIHVYDLVATTTGVHTVEAIFTHPSNTTAVIRIILATFDNVTSRSTPVTAGFTSGNTDITCPSVGPTSVILFVGGWAQSPTAFNRTERRLIGTSAIGNGDYLMIGTATGASPSVQFTASNGGIGHGEICIEYKGT